MAKSKLPTLLNWILTSSVTLAVSIATGEPLETDRPDATESSSVVGRNTVQLETGTSFVDDDAEETFAWLGTLVRIGLDDRWEARIAWDGYIDSNIGGADGTGDGELGFKYFMQEEVGSVPQMALIVHSSVPIGDDLFTSDTFDPSFLLSFSHSTSETSSLGYNIGASLESSLNAFGDKTTLASLDYSIAYGFGVTENAGAYIEIFGSQGLSARASPIHVDGGFAYLLNDDTQLDLFAGAGLNDDAPNWFIGIGLSKRWR